MKVLILAGGYGTRLGEETNIRPKPMVEIGGLPILWHIMKIYSHYGFNDFVILTGYKQEVIKDYFVNYHMKYSDITVDLASNSISVHRNHCEPWKVTLLNTGADTMTAGRIHRAKAIVGNEPFMLTYGDGVGDIPIPELIENHKNSGKLCTLTAYQPVGRWGALKIDAEGAVRKFVEKPKDGGSWINAGFFVCEPEIFDYLPENSDEVMWEQAPLQTMARDGKLNSFNHTGFWHAMDMLKDKEDLNKMWAEGDAPWKLWD